MLIGGAAGRRTHRLAGLLAAVALTAAACGDGAAAEGRGDESATASPATGSSGFGTPTTAPTEVPSGTHAVRAPGRLTGGVVSADLLVVAADTMSADVVRRVREVPGVTSVERISLAQLSVQDQLLDVAAVDPATYRRYTPVDSATSQAVWARVAQGDVALLPGQARRLRNQGGVVQLGSDASAPAVPLGAIAPQVQQIDAVVNRTWTSTLGMKEGNALIVSTGITAPAGVQAPVERVVGKDVSVQRLDVAARLGLDPSVEQTAVVAGSVQDAVGVYRYSVSGGRVIPDPSWVAANITTASVPILGDVTCNRVLIPQLSGALQDIVDAGLTKEIDPSDYGGCYNARFIAGTTQLSNHAFGLAVDLNVQGNLRGTVGLINRQVVAIFKSWGFTWGGDWRYTDPMHFELSSIVTPG